MTARRLLVFLSSWIVVFAACRPSASPVGPERACVARCAERAPNCGTEGGEREQRCARGCNFVLDRLLEHEGDNVLACVARSSSPCSDALWAECAARIGVHADGGPPPPAPRSED